LNRLAAYPSRKWRADHLRHGVHPEALHARFHISNIGEPQSEDFAAALVFIGKNSKEK
jgi:hypothetical protein